MQYLKVKNGVLHSVTNAEEIKRLEEKPDNWEYRLVTASGQFCLIDYDKDEARPYVKALLAKVNKLKEVKMLWFVLFLQVLFLIGISGGYVLQMLELSDLKKSVGLVSEQVRTVQKNPNEQKTLTEKEQQLRTPEKIEFVREEIKNPMTTQSGARSKFFSP